MCRCAVVVCTALLAPGCITQQAQQINLDIAALQDSLRTVYARQDALYEHMVQMDERLDAQDTRFEEIHAEHAADVADLESRILSTQTNADQTQDRIASLSQRMDSLDRRVSGARAPARADSAGLVALEDMGAAYDRAYLDFSKAKYQLAIQGFTDYLKNYPGTERADNAQYWIGECYYVQRDYDSAIEAFQRVLDQYPDGNKAAGAMLKIGYALLSLDREQQAIRQLKTVMERYPQTTEAEHARAKLLSLNQ